MGRRELTNGLLLAVFGLGGAAMVTGLLSDPTPYTPLMVWGGVAAMAGSGAGLARLFFTAPKPPIIVPGVPADPSAQPPGRDFIDPALQPRDLTKKVEGRTSVQVTQISKPFLGRWMRVSGEVADVSEIADDKWYLQLTIGESHAITGALFKKRWHGQLAALNKGDQVTVVGEIARIGTGVSLENAEIEAIDGPKPKPEAEPKPPPKPRAPRKKPAPKADS